MDHIAWEEKWDGDTSVPLLEFSEAFRARLSVSGLVWAAEHRHRVQSLIDRIMALRLKAKTKGKQGHYLYKIRGSACFSPKRASSPELSGDSHNSIPTSTASMPASPGGRPRGAVREGKKSEQQFDPSVAKGAGAGARVPMWHQQQRSGSRKHQKGGGAHRARLMARSSSAH